jgi:hypothetical protein
MPRIRPSWSTSTKLRLWKIGISVFSGASPTGSLKPFWISHQSWPWVPVRNFQWDVSASLVSAKALSTSGLSCSGSTLKLTRRMSAHFGSARSSDWRVRISLVVSGQTVLQRVKMKFAM